MSTRTLTDLPSLVGAIVLAAILTGCSSQKWQKVSSVVPPFLKSAEQKEVDRTTEEFNQATKAYDQLINGRPVHEPVWITATDIKNLHSLAECLDQTNRTIDQYVAGKLSSGTKKALMAWRADPSKSNTEALQQRLVKDLNSMIRGPSLDADDRFKDVDLEKETLTLLSQNAQGKDRVRLNRMLLEDAYPNGLRRTPERLAATDQVARREAEVERIFARKRMLDAQVAQTVAVWDKRLRNRGYLAIGNKTAIVGMGIAVAALSVANPAANAVWIAGLGAGAAGLVGIESRADEVGFSTQIFQAKGDALSDAAKTAAAKFSQYSEFRLRAMAADPTTSNEVWDTALQSVGDAMNSLEIAARYTRSTIKIEVVPPSTNTTPAGPRIQGSSWRFSVNDYRDLPSLAERLKKPETGTVDAWLFKKLSDNTRTALNAYDKDPKPLPEALLQELNRLVVGGSIYKDGKEAFDRLKLRSETRALIQLDPQEGSDLNRLNRLLLEDAYPQELYTKR